MFNPHRPDDDPDPFPLPPDVEPSNDRDAAPDDPDGLNAARGITRAVLGGLLLWALIACLICAYW